MIKSLICVDDKKKCTGCYACYNICPTKCISMKRDFEGFLYPCTDSQKCINCNRCVQVCPVRNHNKKLDFSESVYAAYSKLNVIRQDSSSGGVFTHLAEYILKQGGVVFGATFDSKFQVHHIQVDSIQRIGLLRGSKYVQSRIEKTYEAAKTALKDNKMVLFTGTPCQIDGLKLFLGHEYDKLYTQDIVCHGVSSPAVWDRYLQTQIERKHADIKNVRFRDKTNGWNKYSLTVEFDDKEPVSSIFTANPMMRAYLRDMCLRPSCYECPSKGIKHSSDITLGDFWNVEDYFLDLNDNRGIDLVICHSQKGENLFDNIKKSLEWRQGDISMVSTNLPLIQSPKRPSGRDNFINEILQNIDFETVVDKYCSIPLSERVLTKINLIIKRLWRK